MNNKHNLQLLFSIISEKIGGLTEQEIENILKGSHDMKIQVVKNINKKTNDSIQNNKLEDIINHLNTEETRESAQIFLESSAFTKKELESIARRLDIFILKQDSGKQIIEKIVESTVGSRLRSNAIQGKE